MVKRWLSDFLPLLDEGEIKTYAGGLSNVRFCQPRASVRELKYRDLDFMKEPHRGYFYKEITGK